MAITKTRDGYYNEGYNIYQVFRVTHRGQFVKYRDTSVTPIGSEIEMICDIDNTEYMDIRDPIHLTTEYNVDESWCTTYKASDSIQIGALIDSYGILAGYCLIQLGDEEKAIVADRPSSQVPKYYWRQAYNYKSPADGVTRQYTVILCNTRVAAYNAYSEAELENAVFVMDEGSYNAWIEGKGYTNSFFQLGTGSDRVGMYDLNGLHYNRFSFSHPEQQMFSQEGSDEPWYGWKIAVDGTEDPRDRFTEDMYCISEMDIDDTGGWSTLEEIQAMGYDLYVERTPAVTILGDVGFQSAITLYAGTSGYFMYFNHVANVANRIPFDDTIETVLYYRYFISASRESAERPEGITFYASGKQLVVRNTGSSDFSFYGVHAYKVASKEVETVKAWATNGSELTAWFIKWHDMYCWMNGTNTDWLTKEQWENNNWSFTEVITCYTNQSHSINNDKTLNPGESCVLYDYNGNTLERPSDSQWRVLYAVYNGGAYHSGDNGFEVTVGFLDIMSVQNVGNNPRQPRKLSAIVIQLIE